MTTMQKNIENNSPIYTLVGFVVALGFPFLFIFFGKSFFSSSSTLFINELMQWAIAGFLIFMVRQIQKQPLSSLGFQAFNFKTVLWALLCLVGIFVAGGLSALLIKLMGLESNQTLKTISKLASFPIWAKFLIALRAGVVEEIIFRGFAIESLTRILKNRWVAASISLVLFTLIHLQGWGLTHLISVGLVGAVITLFYLWKRNLWITIIAHFLVDFIAMMAPPTP